MEDVMAAVVDRFTQVLSPLDLQKRASRLKGRDRTLQRTMQTHKRLQRKAETVGGRLMAKTDELHLLKKKLEVDQAFADFPELSLEPFGWRTPQGWPRLALFSYDDIKKNPGSAVGFGFRIAAGHSSIGIAVVPKLPLLLSRCFTDVIERLTGRAFFGTADLPALVTKGEYSRTSEMGRTLVTLETRYGSGPIPADVLHRVEARRGMFEQLLIVAEAAEWRILTETIPAPERSPCPLVVGIAENRLWLVDKYSTTLQEAYIAKEHTTS